MKKVDISKIKTIQAPLAGISDYVFRQMIRKYSNSCLLTTEMLSSEALSNCPNPKIAVYDESEYPLSFQIVGHKPHLMARAAKLLENRASVIDMNFGCPVNKIVKSKDGSGLMRDINLARDVVKAVRDAIEIPLSAKFRLGWSENEENYIEFAKMLEEEGVNFLTLHGRYRTQLYSGKSNWQKIGVLVNEVNIPVFANGDIKTITDAIECLKITKAHGLSVGRGIMRDFTLLNRIEDYLNYGIIKTEPTLEEKIADLKEHINGEIEKMGEINGIKYMRKFYPFYISSMRNASKYRERLVRIENKKELLETLDEILDIYTSN